MFLLFNFKNKSNLIKSDYVDYILLNRYNNSVYLNFFLNLKIRSGNSKSFKKKFIYTYSYFLYKNRILTVSLNSLIYNINKSKPYRVIFLQKTGITYINHKKKYISKLTFSLLHGNKRNFFFIKFLKFFFFKNLYKCIGNLVLYNYNNDNSIIYNVYKRLHYVIIFKNLKS